MGSCYINEEFSNLFTDQRFHLPKIWGKDDFLQSVKKLLTDYECKVLRCESLISEFEFSEIAEICDSLTDTIDRYLKGFPADAYNCFDLIMKRLIEFPLDILNKRTHFGSFHGDKLRVYRIVKEVNPVRFTRERIFHPPFNLRTKISTNRYSIAGFPCLYLGTSVELCLKELGVYKNQTKNYICSRFQVVKNSSQEDFKIKVLELAVKPQDFLVNEHSFNGRKIDLNWLQDSETQKRYLFWYPLIATCSFVRREKKDPFAPEYIVPQLLLQWLRKQNSNEKNKFWGLRYFSCHSDKDDCDLGFNYVFPTSGEGDVDHPNYCKVLGCVFELTKPVSISAFSTIDDCEQELNKYAKLGYFYDKEFEWQK